MNRKKVSRKAASLWHLTFSYSNIGYAIITGLLLVPLYLRYIPLELYGAWLATGNILNWVLVVDPGLSSVILQRVGHSYGAGKLGDMDAYIVGGLIITLGIVILVVFLGLVAGAFLPRIVNLENPALTPDLITSFYIAVAASGVTLVAFCFSNVNQAMQRSFAHGLIYLIANISSLATTVILLFAGFGLTAIASGMLARAFVFAGGGGYYMFYQLKKEKIALGFDGDRLKEIFGLLSFTAMGKVGRLLARNMDALLIARFIGPETVPVFVLTRRGLSIAEMLLNRTGNAVAPGLSHLSGDCDQTRMRNIVSRLFKINLWILGLAFGGFLAFNQDFIRVWVGDQFFAGAWVSATLCCLLVVSIFVTLMQTLCSSLGDIKRNAMIQFWQALVTVTALVLGIRYMGLLGAALAPLIGFMAVGLHYYPRSLASLSHFEPATWRSIAIEGAYALGLGGVLASFMFLLPPAQDWFGFLLGSACFGLVYTLLLTALRPELRCEFGHLIRVLSSKLFSRTTPAKNA